MNANPYKADLVSIITPAYRVESIIQETIHSVIKQTYPNWELLIADDCSPDGTANVVAGSAQIDARIRLIRCKVNGGPASARNAALTAANGRWVAFLDSDDVWMPSKLEETIQHAILNQSALTFTGYRRMSIDGKVTGSFISVPDTLTYQGLLGNTAIATSTVLIDRHLTGDFLMKKVFYDDFACWLDILKRGFTANGLNKDLMRYRIVSNSVSRNKRRSAAEVWKAYRDIEKLGLIRSAWYFARYSVNAFLKYRRF
jgi:teichuronic acid biosynthesis glycosyltransferase TuaG